jgi:hypothetical protein
LRSIPKALTSLALIALLSVSAFAGSRLEFGTKAVYTSNLLLQSTDASLPYSTESADFYITDNVSFNFNPLSFAELNLNGLHKAHSKMPKYDTRLGGLGLTLIPIKEESPLTLYSKLIFNGSRFGKGLEDFNSNTFSIRTAAGYWFSDAVRARLGVFYQDNAYTGSDVMDRKSYEIYSGVNFSLLGAYALDIEVGFADAKYLYISPNGLHNPVNPDIIDALLKFVTFTEGHLESFYISPRLSRPIGSKSGVSVTFTYKEFPDLEEGVVFGATSENLSPWAEVWQGRTVSASFKTYLIPNMIVSAGIDYSDKSYLRIHDDLDQPFYSKDTGREDEQTKLNLNIQRHIAGILGFSGEPSLSIDWTNNTSSKPLYDCSGINISFGFKFRL